MRERDGEPGPKTDSDADSKTSRTSSDISESTEVEYQHELSTPLLTTYDTRPSGSEFDLRGEIQRTRERLHFLEQLENASQYNPAPVPNLPDVHDDWVAPGVSPPSREWPLSSNGPDAVLLARAGTSTAGRIPSSPAGKVRNKRKRHLSPDGLDDVPIALKSQNTVLACAHSPKAAKRRETKSSAVWNVPNNSMVSTVDEMELALCSWSPEHFLDENWNRVGMGWATTRLPNSA